MGAKTDQVAEAGIVITRLRQAATAGQFGKACGLRAKRCKKPVHRHEANRKPHLLKVLQRQLCRIGAIDNADDLAPGKAARDAFYLGSGFHPVDKNQIDAQACIALRPFERGVKPLPGQCIGARDHDDVAKLFARGQRGLKPGLGLGDGHHPHAGQLAAAFGRDLVFEMQGSNPGLDVIGHGTANVKWPAIAGIGIGNHRNPGHTAHRAGMLGHFGLGHEAKIGHADPACRRAKPGHVDRLEPCLRDQPCSKRVNRARRRKNTRIRQPLPELFCRHRHPIAPQSGAASYMPSPPVKHVTCYV